MPDTYSELMNLELPCDPQAPAAVRGALHDRSGGTDWRMGDAILVASELVTNAVLHSGCAEDESIQVRVRVRPEHLLISVRDPGASGGDAQVRSSPAIGGWGLQIVEQLTERWGADRAGGYNVWAELALPA
jgi:serine/threonine-protein kinase RsbW